jgi:alpha-methylacyl-CoA racemase
MMLGDLGADGIRLERPAASPAGDPLSSGTWNVLHRGRPSVAVDLKSPDARALVLRLCKSADCLIEGFRPGVMERLGLGPDEVLAHRPPIVYGRMTGYGQDGPMAKAAGHDINYIALSGVLGSITRSGERPVPPMNLVGDFGGGGMLLALGVLAAIIEARASGHGQVVDAAMVDGSALLMALMYGLRSAGLWTDTPGTNFLDTGAHFYEVYETSDGGHVAVGAIEPQFYAQLLAGLGLDPADLPDQNDMSRWPELREVFTKAFVAHDRDHWAKVFAGTDACVTPVLSFAEVESEAHNTERNTFYTENGSLYPAPAPRFSRSVPSAPTPPGVPGADTEAVLQEWI